MASLRIRLAGDGPPYDKLRAAVAARIDAGSLLPGDRLPTVRGLAKELGIAPNTVARAYRALEDEGRIVGRGRAGTFVAERAAESGRERALAEAATRYARLARELGATPDEARVALETALR